MATHDQTATSVPSDRAPRVLLHSDDRTIREQVRLAVGPRLHAGSPAIEWTEVATADAILDRKDLGSFDLVILDGEADKVGGMGICRQLKNEVYGCPPVVVLLGRPQDDWLASWSLADGTVTRPLDPIIVQRVVAEKLGVRAA